VNSGGEEVLLDVGGQDSTEAFEDVGHSDEAREILDGMLVGNLKRVVRSSPYNFPLGRIILLPFPLSTPRGRTHPPFPNFPRISG